MTRRQFMLKAQIDRTKWAREVAPQAYAKFEAAVAKRTGDGSRK